MTWIWPTSTREDYIECVLVWLSFRSIDGVIRDRSVWQLPENVSHHHSIHVMSHVVHMEGRWMWRWACNSQFKIPCWATSYHCFCVLFLKTLILCISLSDLDAQDANVSATSQPKSFATQPAFPGCPESSAVSPKMDGYCSASVRETVRSG